MIVVSFQFLFLFNFCVVNLGHQMVFKASTSSYHYYSKSNVCQVKYSSWEAAEANQSQPKQLIQLAQSVTVLFFLIQSRCKVMAFSSFLLLSAVWRYSSSCTSFSRSTTKVWRKDTQTTQPNQYSAHLTNSDRPSEIEITF